ncbi:MAG: hypothetical protein ABI234_16440 [Ktedonobacteraceae bacterium]
MSANSVVPPLFDSASSPPEGEMQPLRPTVRPGRPEILLLSFNGDEPGPSTSSREKATVQQPAQG